MIFSILCCRTWRIMSLVDAPYTLCGWSQSCLCHEEGMAVFAVYLSLCHTKSHERMTP